MIYKRDALKDVLKTIDFSHAEVHAGDHYFYVKTVDGIANSATVDILLRTPTATSDAAHITTRCTCALGGRYQIHEAGSFTFTAETISAYNNDRSSANTSAQKICSAFTSTSYGITTTGTMLYEDILGSGSSPGVRGMAGMTSREEELILKPATDYIFRFVSWAASNTCAINLEWYE